MLVKWHCMAFDDATPFVPIEIRCVSPSEDSEEERAAVPVSIEFVNASPRTAAAMGPRFCVEPAKR
jgi:hypothetical protein